jgi:type II secretory pathway component GspD/PulD (secretin)
MRKLFLVLVFVAYAIQVNIVLAREFVRPKDEQKVMRLTTENKDKKISLELRGMDILNVLKILSQKSKLKIVAGKKVRGSVSLFLKDVNIWGALKAILETNDLAYEIEEGIIKVITAKDYEKKYGKRFNDKREVKVVHLNYADGTKVVTILTKIKSIKGEVLVDERANSLILVDLPEVIDRMEKVIGEIDKRDRQVLIEAKIIQVILNKEFKMGIDWEYVFSDINNHKVGGKIKGDFNILGESSFGTTFGIGTLDANDYTALIKVLQTVGTTDLLSTPRITVINNQEARILVGTKEAYVTTTTTTSGSGVITTAEEVTFVDVGVKLFVTPTISTDNFIRMKIKPEVSSVDREIITSEGNSIPIVRTSETETTVLVKDGVTIVIAGLIEDKKLDTRNKVPLLGDIPLLGYFFRSTSKQKTKTDLVVFLTPHIVTGAIATEETGKYIPKK